MSTLTQKHNLVMQWLDSVEEAEAGKNHIELRADGVKSGMIITLTHAMPQPEPTTFPAPAKFETITPSSTNPRLIPSTTPVNSLPSPPPSPPPPLSAAPSSPSSVSSEGSDDAMSSDSSEASGDAASSVSEESVSSPSPLPESPSPASDVLPTPLPASSAILPLLPTTLSTQHRSSNTSRDKLPTAESPERPMQEMEALPNPQEQATETRPDTAQAVGIAFGSLVAVASLVLAALIIYKCRKKR